MNEMKVRERAIVESIFDTVGNTPLVRINDK